MAKRIRLIGVPLDLGAGRRGVDMGPSALRVAQIDDRLRRLGHDVEDYGDLTVSVPETMQFGREDLRFAQAVSDVNRRLAEAVRLTMEAGRVPLVLGGDHSIAIGSIAGSSAHATRGGGRIGVIWLDAHADANTPQTTSSGNIHGMSLAISLGLGEPELCGIGRPGAKVAGRNVSLVGVRDLDPGERANLKRCDVNVFTMRDIDERGMADVMKDAITFASDGTAGVHLQLDLDVLDPTEAPGTGTPATGGLSYREAHLAMEMLADADNVLAADVVEINPILDERNRTANLAVELILSALGKRII